MNKILVIQTAFIGDVILATPILEALHTAYPNAIIDVLVRKGNQALFTGHPFLRQALVWDKSNGKYKNLFLLRIAIRRQKYDLVINCQRFAASGFLTAFSGAKVKIGFDKNPFSKRFTHKVSHEISKEKHECERNLELLKPLGISGIAKPKLYPKPLDHKPNEPYVCIAPASVWFTKQFPEHKWVELIQKIGKQKLILLTGGPSDVALCNRILDKLNGYNIKNISGQLQLLQSAELMREAEMNYVNDSAPMHLCSAVDAPVTAIYCSTIPEFGFGPLSSKSFIVQTNETLDCRPCGLHGFNACPKGHFKCAETISAEQIIHS
jgi:ADP-heptose:LPS heptosyltransferase